jgi:hypothetical protein
MTEINTLLIDIQKLLTRKDGWFTEDMSHAFSHSLAVRLQEQFQPRPEKGTLRLSRMGPQCPCALWYSIHHPELAEKMPAWAENKFSLGHMVEAWAITLAKAAGHEVTGEQDAVSVDGIVGHRDCIIDGCVVDVKSAASRSFQKFKDKSIAQDDSFGYLDQLDGYVVGSLEDPLVRVKDKAYLFVIDKQLGHMCLYEHYIRENGIRERIRNYKEIVSRGVPPRCECGTISDGKAGNIKLDARASYNQFKYQCHPSLRTFLYATGPVYLTKVIRRPDVTEVDKDGKIVYGL